MGSPVQTKGFESIATSLSATSVAYILISSTLSGLQFEVPDPERVGRI